MVNERLTKSYFKNEGRKLFESINVDDSIISDMTEIIVSLTKGFDIKKAEDLYTKLAGLIMYSYIAENVLIRDGNKKVDNRVLPLKEGDQLITGVQDVIESFMYQLGEDIGKRQKASLKQNRRTNTKTVSAFVKVIAKTINNFCSRIINMIAPGHGTKDIIRIFAEAVKGVGSSGFEHREGKNLFVSDLERALNPYYLREKESDTTNANTERRGSVSSTLSDDESQYYDAHETQSDETSPVNQYIDGSFGNTERRDSVSSTLSDDMSQYHDAYYTLPDEASTTNQEENFTKNKENSTKNETLPWTELLESRHSNDMKNEKGVGKSR